MDTCWFCTGSERVVAQQQVGCTLKVTPGWVPAEFPVPPHLCAGTCCGPMGTTPGSSCVRSPQSSRWLGQAPCTHKFSCSSCTLWAALDSSFICAHQSCLWLGSDIVCMHIPCGPCMLSSALEKSHVASTIQLTAGIRHSVRTYCSTGHAPSSLSREFPHCHLPGPSGMQESDPMCLLPPWHSGELSLWHQTVKPASSL